MPAPHASRLIFPPVTVSTLVDNVLKFGGRADMLDDDMWRCLCDIADDINKG